MTLQMLEYFAAVAQYRNFTRAAQACHVTQPALSRAIRALEEELGCPLLVRSGRTATLTAQGEVCLTEAQRVLHECDELVFRVREAGRREQRPLRVGYLIISHLSALMQYLSAETAAGGMPIDLETVYGTNGETKRRLHQGEVDAILLPEACVGDLEEVDYAYVVRSQLWAIVHKSNPLADRETLRMADLQGEKIVLWSKGNLPLLQSAHIRICRQAGFTPYVVGEGEKMGDVLAKVTLHNAVGLSGRSSSKAYPGDCRHILIEDSPEQFGVVCVWRRDNPSPQLVALKEIMARGDGRKV